MVDSPEYEVYISGNLALLGNWDTKKIGLKHVNDSVRAIDVMIQLASRVNFTSVNWESEAFPQDALGGMSFSIGSKGRGTYIIKYLVGPICEGYCMGVRNFDSKRTCSKSRLSWCERRLFSVLYAAFCNPEDGLSQLHCQKFTPKLSERQPLCDVSNVSWQMLDRPMS